MSNYDLQGKDLNLEILNEIDNDMSKSKRRILKCHMGNILNDIFFATTVERLMFEKGFEAGFLASQTFNSEIENEANQDSIKTMMEMKNEKDT